MDRKKAAPESGLWLGAGLVRNVFVLAFGCARIHKVVIGSVVVGEDRVIDFAERHRDNVGRRDGDFALRVLAGAKLALHEDGIALLETASRESVVAPCLHVEPVGYVLRFLLPTNLLVDRHAEPRDILAL